MFGSEILDTAIGVIFVFLLVSSLVTIANEMIAAWFLSRAKWLRKGIDRLLGVDVAQKFYDHPMIEGSAADGSEPSFCPKCGKNPPGSGPSYIASSSFVNVLLNVVSEKNLSLIEPEPKPMSQTDATSKVIDTSLLGLKNTLTGVALQAKTLSVGEICIRLQAIIKALPPTAAAINKDLSELLERVKVGDAASEIQFFIDAMPARYLRAGIKNFSDQKIRKTLLLLLDDAENDVDKFKQNIEVWFNNGMDRVNGWYKRKTQWVIATLSILLVVFMNVDTIVIIKYLETHPAERDALVQHAKSYAESTPGLGSKKSDAPQQKDANPNLLTAVSGAAFDGVLTFAKPPAKEEIVKLSLTSSDKNVVITKSEIKVKAKAENIGFSIQSKASSQPTDVTITATGTDPDEVLGKVLILTFHKVKPVRNIITT